MRKSSCSVVLLVKKIKEGGGQEVAVFRHAAATFWQRRCWYSKFQFWPWFFSKI